MVKWASTSLLHIQVFLLLIIYVGNYYYFNRYKSKSSSSKYCDSTNSTIVRKFIRKNWSPLLSRHGVNLPLECPFHISRDMFGARESVKRPHSSHWECRKCGKKFYLEHYLDSHLQLKHRDIINVEEDSVCLGHYCDIMRCDILRLSKILDEEFKSTDMSIWVPHMKDYRTTDTTGGGKQRPNLLLSDLPENQKLNVRDTSGQQQPSQQQPYFAPESCDPESLEKLKAKCIDLVWNCLRGLIATLEPKTFKLIQNELETGVCSFLTCSHYGDVSPTTKTQAPLRPFLLVFGSLLIALCLALAYYFTWIYTRSPLDDATRYEQYTPDTADDEDSTSISISQHSVIVNRTTHI